MKQLIFFFSILCLFAGCSKESNTTQTNSTAPTLNILPGTTITVGYNKSATFSWTTNGVDVTVDDIPYAGGNFTTPILTEDRIYKVTSYSSNFVNDHSSTTVQVIIKVDLNQINIYVAGFDNGRILYWKNGIENLLATTSFANGTASDIIVSDNDIYVSGYVNGHATYWKNNTQYNLTNLTGVSRANCIEVSGHDVYAGGVYGSEAVYWKNGTKVVLGSNNRLSGINSIKVRNGDMYAAGYFGDTAAVWKNGIRINLSSVYSSAYDITFSGNDVYVGGMEDGMPVYWKNGVKTILPAALGSAVTQIIVSGQDIYAVGFENQLTAAYWLNGTRIPLPIPNFSQSVATGIFKLGSDIYITGWVSTSLSSSAVYWKNGTTVYLAGGSNSGRKANAITITGL